MAHRYQSKEKIFSHYHRNQPMSILMYNHRNDNSRVRLYGICYIFENKQYIAPVCRDMDSEKVICDSARYWHWILDDPIDNHIELEVVNPLDYGLLLPLSCDPVNVEESIPPNYYTVTSYIWNLEESVKWI